MARDQMDAVLRQEIESIFEAAIDLSPADRVRYLADRCGADQRLGDEVDAMIAAHERAEGLLEGDVAGAAARALRDIERGRRIGPYRVPSSDPFRRSSNPTCGLPMLRSRIITEL